MPCFDFWYIIVEDLKFIADVNRSLHWLPESSEEEEEEDEDEDEEDIQMLDVKDNGISCVHILTSIRSYCLRLDSIGLTYSR